MKKKRLIQLLFVIAVFFLGIRPSLAVVANPPESLPATPDSRCEQSVILV